MERRNLALGSRPPSSLSFLLVLFSIRLQFLLLSLGGLTGDVKFVNNGILLKLTIDWVDLLSSLHARNLLLALSSSCIGIDIFVLLVGNMWIGDKWREE